MFLRVGAVYLLRDGLRGWSLDSATVTVIVNPPTGAGVIDSPTEPTVFDRVRDRTRSMPRGIDRLLCSFDTGQSGPIRDQDYIQPKPPFEMDWTPILRLVAMTAIFTIIILGSGALVNYVNRLAANLPDTSALIAAAAVGVFLVNVP